MVQIPISVQKSDGYQTLKLSAVVLVDEQRRFPEAWTQQPKPYTPNPRPQTPIPKPPTPNPQTTNHNPKPQTPNASHRQVVADVPKQANFGKGAGGRAGSTSESTPGQARPRVWAKREHLKEL